MAARCTAGCQPAADFANNAVKATCITAFSLQQAGSLLYTQTETALNNNGRKLFQTKRQAGRITQPSLPLVRL